MIGRFRWWLWRRFAWYRRRYPIRLRKVQAPIEMGSRAMAELMVEVMSTPAIEYVGGPLDGQFRPDAGDEIVIVPGDPGVVSDDFAESPEKATQFAEGEYRRRTISVPAGRITVMHWEGWR